MKVTTIIEQENFDEEQDRCQGKLVLSQSEYDALLSGIRPLEKAIKKLDYVEVTDIRAGYCIGLKIEIKK
jgi:hypothetical protein